MVAEQVASSSWQAYWARRGLSLLSARLAKRESAVVAAVAACDLETVIVPDELRCFVAGRLAAEHDRLQQGDPAAIGELFDSTFASPPGRYRIACQEDPVARLVWASRRSDDDPWRLAVLVATQFAATATSWRVARADLGFRQWANVAVWWTLVQTDGEWTIAQVEAIPRGQHYLQDPLPGEPPDEDLRDDATIALAVADGAVATPVAELTEVDAPVRRRLLDLSLVDERYDPDVIAACVGEIARAWEAATEQGDAEALQRWSTPDAVAQLCTPTPNGVRRVRNLDVRHVKIEALDTTVEPPTVAVTADLHGLRWLADRHGSHTPISGNEHSPRSFTEHWTLRFEPQGEAPWRLTHVEHPGRR